MAVALLLLAAPLEACKFVQPGEPSVLDPSLAEARVFGSRDPERGVVLHLHGCDGIRGDPWIRDWARFFAARGYFIVAPDSFAEDERPPLSCQPPFPNKTEIYKLRYAQTKLAIAKIRERFPGKHILIWGHSEGGAVANTIDIPVEGIITTGYQCGYRLSGRTRVSEETPLLAIIGTRDPYVINAIRRSRFSTIHENCERAQISPQWSYLKVQGMGHEAPLSLGGIEARVTQFLEGIAR